MQGDEVTLAAPFPYFGGKRRAAPAIWRALGDPSGYVEPFAGSAAVLLARPEFYVGMSTNIAGRFAKHRQRGWWPLVSAVELYQLPRQPGEAEHAFRYRLHQFELSAIDYLRPTENIAGVSV